MKKILILTLLILSQKIMAENFEVISNPLEANVIVTTVEGKKVVLGRTPYTTSLAILKSTYAVDDTINLSVEKDGFESFNVLAPLIKSTNVKINANLEIQRDLKLTQDMDLLTADLFDALRMMRLKDYKSSYSKLELLEKKFPQFSIVYEMKGAVLYLQNEYKMSLNYYRKAFGINPKNREAYKMKTYLEKKFGIDENSKTVEGI